MFANVLCDGLYTIDLRSSAGRLRAVVMQRGVHLEVSDDFSTTSFNSPVLRFNRYRRDGAA